MRNILLLFTLMANCFQWCPAQDTKKDFGKLSGSIETNNQLYTKDSATAAIVPQDKFGSNSFLKLDYQYKNFTAGVQMESYLPILLGYPGNMDGTKLINKYFTYRNTGSNLEVTVGDFYEQFGNGLIFRSFENRQIGINNALEGLNIRFQPADFLDIKIIYGKQRKYFDFSDGVLRGGDVQVNWNKLAKTKETNGIFKTGFSVISRYDPYTGSNPKIRPTVDAWSAQMDFTSENFYLNAENVHKSTDAHFANSFYTTKGKALQINTGFSKPFFGANLTLRRLENMDFRTDRNAIQGEYLVNFLPALTKQQDYALSNIYVYNAQAKGEIGGQLNMQVYFKKGTVLGGITGANLAINYSRYHNLDITSSNADGFTSNYTAFGKSQYFGDLSLEFKKKLSKKTTATFFYQNLYYNKSVIEGGLYDNIKAQVTVADFLFRYTRKKSFRLELQHLATWQDHKNWAGVLAELSPVAKWTWFVQSLYNYGNTIKKINYYTFGSSYSFNATRLMLGFGRQRAGLVCVGGVCRQVPANTGLNISMTTSF
jgi:hypothetical protein